MVFTNSSIGSCLVFFRASSSRVLPSNARSIFFNALNATHDSQLSVRHDIQCVYEIFNTIGVNAI
jgi:hypothetical protein